MKETLEKYIHDESNGLWYKLQGDYYIPCGFNSQSYFADCFKRKNSISPSKFKKLHKYPS